MKSILTAAAVALGIAIAPLPGGTASAEQVVIVDVTPVAPELASHLRIRVETVPPSVDLPDKLAAVVCDATLKQLRESGGRCVAVGMSQGLIQAVRQAMRGG